MVNLRVFDSTRDESLERVLISTGIDFEVRKGVFGHAGQRIVQTEIQGSILRIVEVMTTMPCRFIINLSVDARGIVTEEGEVIALNEGVRQACEVLLRRICVLLQQLTESSTETQFALTYTYNPHKSLEPTSLGVILS